MKNELTLFDKSSIATVVKRPGLPTTKDPFVQVRNFHGWTLDKLQLFDLYLKAYRRVAGSGTYIDAFAGSGNVRVDGKNARGSTRIALDAKAFKQCRFYEANKRHTGQLKAMLEADYPEKVRKATAVRHGDANLKLVEDLENGLIDRDRPCLAFLDPDSTQLSWSTVEALARYKTFVPGPRFERPEKCKIEMWILFNTHQALMRLVPKQLPPNFLDSSGAKTLDRVMGSREAWIDLLSTRFTYGALLARYEERLKELNYDLVRSFRILDSTTGRPQYYMVHASDHPSAHSLMSWAQNTQLKSTSRTPSMFTEGQLG